MAADPKNLRKLLVAALGTGGCCRSSCAGRAESADPARAGLRRHRRGAARVRLERSRRRRDLRVPARGRPELQRPGARPRRRSVLDANTRATVKSRPQRHLLVASPLRHQGRRPPPGRVRSSLRSPLIAAPATCARAGCPFSFPSPRLAQLVAGPIRVHTFSLATILPWRRWSEARASRRDLGDDSVPVLNLLAGTYYWRSPRSTPGESRRCRPASGFKWDWPSTTTPVVTDLVTRRVLRPAFSWTRSRRRGYQVDVNSSDFAPGSKVCCAH